MIKRGLTPIIIDGVDFTNVLTPGEVAEIFKVSSKTVARWAVNNKLPYITTIGGHRRYSKKQVYEMLGTS